MTTPAGCSVLNASVISAKCYALFTGVPGDEDFEIDEYSEHGLGHLVDTRGVTQRLGLSTAGRV